VGRLESRSRGIRISRHLSGTGVDPNVKAHTHRFMGTGD
jgi:hypothetical protein